MGIFFGDAGIGGAVSGVLGSIVLLLVEINPVFVFFHGNGQLQFLLCHVYFGLEDVESVFEAFKGFFFAEAELCSPEFGAFGEIVGAQSVSGVAVAEEFEIVGSLLYFEDSTPQPVKGIGIMFTR